ncbi:hypothetical protein Cgig2_026198 [Carnegiea gigantea]|uniref:Uncharacterized protein n=1 Tax=Carnegiea gigantea TaxID=171969 RepID=A0A9Q1GKY4_9CARY|nr:hypothetical protein Cgig2_026198 [Carnegiea gigantea]
MSDSDEAPARLRPFFGTENSWCRAFPAEPHNSAIAPHEKPAGFLPPGKFPPKTPERPPYAQIQAPIRLLNQHFLSPHPPISTPPSPALRSPIDGPDRPTRCPAHPFQNILEHELNRNSWQDGSSDVDVLHGSVYALDGGKWALVMRIHTGACDRTAAVAVLRELLRLMMNPGLPGLSGWSWILIIPLSCLRQSTNTSRALCFDNSQ